jgi:hypothetical protein
MRTHEEIVACVNRLLPPPHVRNHTNPYPKRYPSRGWDLTVAASCPRFHGKTLDSPSYGQITLSVVEIAWAAGLFDGEGTATICGGQRRLAVKMADEESVRRFHAAIGVGKVYGPYEHRTATLRDGSLAAPPFYG